MGPLEAGPYERGRCSSFVVEMIADKKSAVAATDSRNALLPLQKRAATARGAITRSRGQPPDVELTPKKDEKALGYK